MISAELFLRKATEIANEKPTYQPGRDGSDGKCDCIGLVIGAIRRAGGSWPGTHGSNYAWRYQMARQVKQVAATELELGWLVYKARSPAQAGYALPDKYKQGGKSCTGDLLDYYHVGMVTGVEPLRITHCTKGGGVNGIAVDTKQGQWLYAGPCSLIDYTGDKGEEENVTQATVNAPSGGTVNMRRGASLKAELVCRIPIGEQVAVMIQQGAWCYIGWDGRVGYIQTKYLDGVEDEPKGLLAELKALVAKYEKEEG